MKNPRSRVLDVLPAGGNGEFNLPDKLATAIRSGEGCRPVTADGREMLGLFERPLRSVASHRGLVLGSTPRPRHAS